MREFGRVGSFLRVSAAPCAERAKSDRVHVSTYFDVDTIFRPWLVRSEQLTFQAAKLVLSYASGRATLNLA